MKNTLETWAADYLLGREEAPGTCAADLLAGGVNIFPVVMAGFVDVVHVSIDRDTLSVDVMWEGAHIGTIEIYDVLRDLYSYIVRTFKVYILTGYVTVLPGPRKY